MAEDEKTVRQLLYESTPPPAGSKPGVKAARACGAWDIILITGGLQCGNCLAWSQDGSPLRHGPQGPPRP